MRDENRCEILYHEVLCLFQIPCSPLRGDLVPLVPPGGSFSFSAPIFKEGDTYPRERRSFKTLRLRNTQRQPLLRTSPSRSSTKFAKKVVINSSFRGCAGAYNLLRLKHLVQATET